VVMDKHGWIAMGLGTFFSLLIGCGLMALMFFSSRSGHDEAADPFRNKREPPGERARRGGLGISTIRVTRLNALGGPFQPRS
jgi:hypothetical protein